MCGYKFYCETEKDFLKIESQLFKKGYSWEFFENSALKGIRDCLPCWFYTDGFYIWRSNNEKNNRKLLKIKHVWI